MNPYESNNTAGIKFFLGDGYIPLAFHYAYEADPNALLMINESFGNAGVDPAKVDAMIELVQQLRSEDVAIHLVGVEMHLDLSVLRSSYVDEFRYLLSRTREIGIDVLVSEMDVYQGPSGYLDHPFYVQKNVYQSILSTCLDFSHCRGIVVWGVSDKYSWLRSDPFFVDARPLLFDEWYRPKPAYYGLLKIFRTRLQE